MAKHFVNGVEDIVDEALSGLLRTRPDLVRLDAPSGIRVVVRKTPDHDKVALISGGGSGHEPAHAGFVGEGMLDAAVCGDIFASPPVDAVLEAIRAVTGPKGALVIIKNYTGDRLNFGLAAERARSEGLKVETVLVADDIALGDAVAARGLAGTLFVHKIAGAAAQAGEPLEAVAALAREVSEQARTLSLSLTGCAIPGHDEDRVIGDDEAEFGLGIHGEPGAKTVPMASARDLLNPLGERLLETIGSDVEIALMINTLGGVSPLEALVVADTVLAGPLGRHARLIVGPGPMMTSLGMQGVSLTALPLNEAFRDRLAAPTASPAWLAATPAQEPSRASMRTGRGAEGPAPSEDPSVRAILRTACDAIEAMAADLDRIDGKVGDGDTGSTFAAGARTIISQMDTLPLADMPALLISLSDLLARRAGGSSGILVSILFAAAGRHLAEESGSLVKALRYGLSEMKRIGGADLGDRTMIDALEPALEAWERGTLEEAAKAARAGSEATASMKSARAGRSAYVPESHLSGIVDPGAEGVARLFEAFATGQDL